MNTMFMIGDKVSYCGSRWKLAGKLGIIISHVQNQEDTYVVEFDDTFVMSGQVLTRYNPSQIKERVSSDEEEQPKRRKRGEPEVETKHMRTMISEDDQSYAD